MSGERSVNGEDARLFDDVDRLLARELSVDPSPDFLARVRVAIDARPVSSSWWHAARRPFAAGRWTWVPVAATIAIVAIVLVQRGSGPDTPAREPIAMERGAIAPNPMAPAPIAAGSRLAVRTLPLRHEAAIDTAPRATRASVRPATLDMEVLVDPAEARAFQLLMARRRTAAALDIVPPDEATSLKELRISPLKIDLLPVPRGADGVLDPPPAERPRDSPRSAW